MMLANQPPQYRVLLLRCWEERSSQEDEVGAWRFSVEDTKSGARRGFADLDSLVHFLQVNFGTTADDMDGRSND